MGQRRLQAEVQGLLDAGDCLRLRQDGRAVHRDLEAGAGAVDVRVPRRRRADQQRGGAGAATRGVERERSFGCHSEADCRFLERLLSVMQTLACVSVACWSI